MNDDIPDLISGHLKQVVVCWHTPKDGAPDITGIEGMHVFGEKYENGEIRGRCIIDSGVVKLSGSETDVVHIHLEFASVEIFSKTPTPTSSLDTVSEYVSRFSGCDEIQPTMMSARFKIAFPQIAVGSILNPVFKVGMKMQSAALVEGKFVVDSEEADTLSFEVDSENDTPFFWVTVEGKGQAEISLKSIRGIAKRMLSVFNSFVLANPPVRARSKKIGAGESVNE